MKTNYIIVAIIFLAFSFGGCTMKENYEYKTTIVPLSESSVTTPNKLNSAAEVIRKRLNDSPGIQNESIKLDVTGNRISLTLSLADTSIIPSLKNKITGYAQLEFRETYENSQIIGYLTKANDLLKEMKVVPVSKSSGTTDVFISQNPLFGILRPMINEKGEPLGSCLVGVASGNDTALVDSYLKMPGVKDLFPGDLQFMWSYSPFKNDSLKKLYELLAIKVTTPDGKAPLDGSVIISANPVNEPSNSDNRIQITMNADGAARWAGITRANINRCIAIVINGHVRSYPRVMTEVSGGKTELSGSFTPEEASELSGIFKSGELPFELKIIDEQIIKMK